MKGGVLRTHNTTSTRHAVAFFAVVAMVALPLLLLGGPEPTQASAARSGSTAQLSRVAGHQQRHLRRIMLVGTRLPIPTTSTTTTPTTAPTVASAPPVTAAPSAPVHLAAPTPTTVPPAPVTTTTRPMSSASGLATWYAWRTGQCASPWLPMGTSVIVRNVATGATASCVVTDREAANPGRIIDLDTSVFSAIAPLSAGAVSVTVSW